MIDSLNRNWARIFNKRKNNVHDKVQTGWHSLANLYLMRMVEWDVCEKKESDVIFLPSRFPTLQGLFGIVKNHLRFHQVSALSVAKMLILQQTRKCVVFSLKFLTPCYHEGVKERWSQIVIGDEVSVFSNTPESKRQSLHCNHADSQKSNIHI